MSKKTEHVVHVKPIRRASWLPSGHDGEVRFTNCAEFLTVPMNTTTRSLETGLTDEDEDRLEKSLLLKKGTLSRFNNEYWGDYHQTIRISKDGIMLNLNNPKDELIYLNLRAHPDVANSESERDDNPSCKYVITSDEQKAKVENAKNKIKREAYKMLGKMSTSEMKDVLKIVGKKVSKDASIDFIENAATKIIEDRPQAFIEVVEDPNFKMKVFIDDCLSIKALVRHGSKYMLTGGDQIGATSDQAIEYLGDPNNQDILRMLKAKVETDKK